MTQPQQPYSMARTIITPLILVIAGLIIFGQGGALVGAAIGALYVMWAAGRGRRTTVADRPTPTSTDHAATLGQLASLRDQGAITEAEYEAKKRDLLARM